MESVKPHTPLTTRHAAISVQLSTYTIRRAIRNGELKATKTTTGRGTSTEWCIRWKDLHRLGQEAAPAMSKSRYCEKARATMRHHIGCAQAALGPGADAHEIRVYVLWQLQRAAARQATADLMHAERGRRHAAGEFTPGLEEDFAVGSTRLNGHRGAARRPYEASPQANLEVLADPKKRYVHPEGTKRVQLDLVLPGDFYDRLDVAISEARGEMESSPVEATQ